MNFTNTKPYLPNTDNISLNTMKGLKAKLKAKRLARNDGNPMPSPMPEARKDGNPMPSPMPVEKRGGKIVPPKQNKTQERGRSRLANHCCTGPLGSRSNPPLAAKTMWSQ